jgi:predicted enzyme related to lactoylglutathione lyase
VTHRSAEHGQLTYLQIPAVDPQVSARFYARVFGWKLEPGHASFEAPGFLFGQWVTDRPAAREGGPLLWIAVRDIETGLGEIGAAGGTVLEGPAPDGPRLIATFRDPAGNVVGIVQEPASA